MSSQSSENPQNPVEEVVKSSNESQQDARMEANKPNPPSVFVNSEPMREDQIENAVKFLSHPKVKGSPVIYRRSFLEKKGLTKEEIDEAFRRVPDPPSSAQPTNVRQDGGLRSSSNVHQTGPIQTPQPAAAASSGVSTAGATKMQPRFHWYHAAIAVGLLAVSGAGTAVLIKNAIMPRLKSWIRKVVREEKDDDLPKKSDSKPSMAEEAAAAAKAAAAAASDVAKASQELLNSKHEEKKYFEELAHLLDLQVKEMKSMSTAFHKLDGQYNFQSRASLADQEHNRVSAAYSKQTYANDKLDYDSHSGRSTSPPVYAEPSVASHPKSYMEKMAMVQRGERPSNIRDIDDQPHNAKQPITNSHLAPITKPWDVSQVQSNSSRVLETQFSGEAFNSKVQDNGVNYRFDGEINVPWWQQKSARITEIENEEEPKDGPYNGRINEQRVQHSWVPPQPPPVVMPEAAETIWQPKPLVKKEQSAAAKSSSHSRDVTDELQRVTKISESGTAVETNGAGMGLNSIEIQEEQDDRFD